MYPVKRSLLVECSIFAFSAERQTNGQGISRPHAFHAVKGKTAGSEREKRDNILP
jgi:hypothetical protein